MCVGGNFAKLANVHLWITVVGTLENVFGAIFGRIDFKMRAVNYLLEYENYLETRAKHEKPILRREFNEN